MDKPLLTPDQVSEYLGIPVTTLYQWKLRGVGPKAAKIGRHLRYTPESVRRYVAEQSGDRAA